MGAPWLFFHIFRCPILRWLWIQHVIDWLDQGMARGFITIFSFITGCCMWSHDGRRSSDLHAFHGLPGHIMCWDLLLKKAAMQNSAIRWIPQASTNITRRCVVRTIYFLNFMVQLFVAPSIGFRQNLGCVNFDWNSFNCYLGIKQCF